VLRLDDELQVEGRRQYGSLKETWRRRWLINTIEGVKINLIEKESLVQSKL
jgi:hypothetical protein